MAGPDDALTLAEFEILNACADDYEIFYNSFAAINYGGQVSRRDPDSPIAQFLERFEDEGPWEVMIPGEEVARYMARLIWSGLLRCWRVSDDPDESAGTLNPERPTSFIYPGPIEVTEPDEREFALYNGYNCVTREEHEERFGYGPHEFRTTEAGIREIHRPIYDELYGD